MATVAEDEWTNELDAESTAIERRHEAIHERATFHPEDCAMTWCIDDGSRPAYVELGTGSFPVCSPHGSRGAAQ